MKERARMLSGAFEIVSQPMHGTQILCPFRLSALPRDERRNLPQEA